MVTINLNWSLVVRADSTTRMGTGHVMRCLALAQAWVVAGGNVRMVSHCDSRALQERIEASGSAFEFLPVMHPDPLDLESTLAAAQSGDAWVVLDGYHFDPGYHQSLSDAGHKLLIIDDTAHLRWYHADILLNQNIDAPGLPYQTDPNTLRLLGTRYAMLRPEFLDRGPSQRPLGGASTRLLVTLGGGDHDNISHRVLRALERCQCSNLEVVVAVGYANPNVDMLQRAAAESRHRITVQSNIADMPAVMAWANVAISAAGSTCWELSYMGLPSVVIISADNQRGIAQGLEEEGVVINLGWHEDVDEEHIARAVDELLVSPSRRAAMTDLGQQLVDGLGSGRILDSMLKYSFPPRSR